MSTFVDRGSDLPITKKVCPSIESLPNYLFHHLRSFPIRCIFVSHVSFACSFVFRKILAGLYMGGRGTCQDPSTSLAAVMPLTCSQHAGGGEDM